MCLRSLRTDMGNQMFPFLNSKFRIPNKLGPSFHQKEMTVQAALPAVIRSMALALCTACDLNSTCSDLSKEIITFDPINKWP